MMPPLANIIQDTFQPLIDVFESVLSFFHDSIGLPWGWSIIALTIAVRTVLIPLTYRQLKATQAMQQHAPELKKLQARYKDDKQKQQQEMMKFYKENKVNPFGSCLPLLFQMPVFISLFYMLRTDLKVDICPGIKQWVAANHHSLGDTSCTQYGDATHQTFATNFLFIPDITAKATGVVLVILIVLYVGSQLASSTIMSVTADRTQRLLMMGLPFVFTIFIINFPAGLILYWITTNFWTVGQALVVRRMRMNHQAELDAQRAIDEANLPPGAKPPEPEREPEPEEKKGFFARLDPMGGAATASAAPDERRGNKTPKAAGKGGSGTKESPKPKGDSNGTSGGKSAPPPPPRQKKKRSGRRK
jgi:YidC/Oxa1 family membrane protein insertase